MYKSVPFIALCWSDPQCDYVGVTNTHYCLVVMQYGVLLE